MENIELERRMRDGAMDDACKGNPQQESKFANLNATLQNLSGDLKSITIVLAGHLDRLVGVPTESPEKSEKPLIEPSGLGLVGALQDSVGMLQRQITELHEQLNRVDGKF